MDGKAQKTIVNLPLRKTGRGEFTASRSIIDLATQPEEQVPGAQRNCLGINTS